VKWRGPALLDLERLVDFQAAKNQTKAGELGVLLLATAESLRLVPLRGTPLAKRSRVRVLRVPLGDEVYLVHYTVLVDVVWILQVKHARER
jgi:plasmid stabilization system protein ParE